MIRGNYSITPRKLLKLSLINELLFTKKFNYKVNENCVIWVQLFNFVSRSLNHRGGQHHQIAQTLFGSKIAIKTKNIYFTHKKTLWLLCTIPSLLRK